MFESHQLQLQACDLIDRRLEYLLLVVALLEELGRDHPRLRVTFEITALLLDEELFFRRYFDRHPLTEIHCFWGRDRPIVPMNCPRCSAPVHRTRQVNNTCGERTVRQRSCEECSHRWFTVELEVSKYAVYWQQVGRKTSGKPQIREDAEVSLAVTLPSVEKD